MENRRSNTGKVAPRTVLYLGEINDSPEAAWHKSAEVFDESAKPKPTADSVQKLNCSADL